MLVKISQKTKKRNLALSKRSINFFLVKIILMIGISINVIHTPIPVEVIKFIIP